MNRKKTNQSCTSPCRTKNPLWRKIGHENQIEIIQSSFASEDDLNKTSLEFEIQLLEKEERQRKQKQKKNWLKAIEQ